mmetsp:Transcript_88580/g.236774  ORF Transcript_88580/g.236774 Transcript_88580/m.236774 type:complete len:227 (+) Transcript_88580:1185-1865(+)
MQPMIVRLRCPRPILIWSPRLTSSTNVLEHELQVTQHLGDQPPGNTGADLPLLPLLQPKLRGDRPQRNRLHASKQLISMPQALRIQLISPVVYQVMIDVIVNVGKLRRIVLHTILRHSEKTIVKLPPPVLHSTQVDPAPLSLVGVRAAVLRRKPWAGALRVKLQGHAVLAKHSVVFVVLIARLLDVEALVPSQSFGAACNRGCIPLHQLAQLVHGLQRVTNPPCCF